MEDIKTSDLSNQQQESQSILPLPSIPSLPPIITNETNSINVNQPKFIIKLFNIELIIGGLITIIFLSLFFNPLINLTHLSHEFGPNPYFVISWIRLLSFCFVLAECISGIYRIKHKVLLQKHLLSLYIYSILSSILIYILIFISLLFSSTTGNGGGIGLIFIIPTIISFFLFQGFFLIFVWFLNKWNINHQSYKIITIIVIIVFIISLFINPLQDISDKNKTEILKLQDTNNTNLNKIMVTDNAIYFIDDRPGFNKNNGLKVYGTKTDKVTQIDSNGLDIINITNGFLYYHIKNNNGNGINRIKISDSNIKDDVFYYKTGNRLSTYDFKNNKFSELILPTYPTSINDTNNYSNDTEFNYFYKDENNDNFYYLFNKNFSSYNFKTQNINIFGTSDTCDSQNGGCKYININNYLIYTNRQGFTVVDLAKKEIVDRLSTGFDYVYNIKTDGKFVYLLLKEQPIDVGKYKILKADIINKKYYVSTARYSQSMISNNNLFYNNSGQIKNIKLSSLNFIDYNIQKQADYLFKDIPDYKSISIVANDIINSYNIISQKYLPNSNSDIVIWGKNSAINLKDFLNFKSDSSNDILLNSEYYNKLLAIKNINFLDFINSVDNGQLEFKATLLDKEILKCQYGENITSMIKELFNQDFINSNKIKISIEFVNNFNSKSSPIKQLTIEPILIKNLTPAYIYNGPTSNSLGDVCKQKYLQ